MPDFDAINTALVARFTAALVLAPSAVDYRSAVLATNPVGYWRLGESSGTVAVDQMGANNGTYANAPTLGVPGLLTGDPDTAIATSGGSSLSVPDSAMWDCLEGVNPWTIGFLTNYVQDATSRILFDKAGAGSSKVRIYDFNTPRLIVIRTDAAGVSDAHNIAPLSAGRRLVFVTFSGTQVLAFSDGVQLAFLFGETGAGTRVMPALTTNARFHSDYAGTAGTAITGTLDEPAIWNRALTPAEIATLYSAGTVAYDPIRVATGDLPGQMTPLPTVLVFPVSGTFDQKGGGKRDSTNTFTVRFYYNQVGDAERDFPALRRWLSVLVDQLRASVQLGGLTWSNGVRQGEVTRVTVTNWRIGILTYAGVPYSGIELDVSVLVNESLTMVA